MEFFKNLMQPQDEGALASGQKPKLSEITPVEDIVAGLSGLMPPTAGREFAVPQQGQPQVPIQPPQQPPGMNTSALREDFVQRKGQESSRLAEPQTGIKGIPTQPDPEADKKRADFISRMVRVGVPLGAAIAGSISPGILPQTAGLATGFEGEMQRQDRSREENEGTKPFILVDPETGKQTQFDVPKKAIVQQQRTDQGGIFGKLGIDPSLLDIPEAKTGDAVKKAREKVKVINAEGQEFMLPKTQLDDAKKQGYKVAE